VAGPIIVKLGGSLITVKDKPYTLNKAALKTACRALSSFGGDLVVVHGGGSYGHAAASKHGLSSSEIIEDSRGASETRLAMHELSLAVLKELFDSGLNPVLAQPLLELSGDPWPLLAAFAARAFAAGLTPVLHGDVALAPGGFRIVSGDEIVWRLSEHLRPERVVFLMDVPGVLRDPADKSSTICCLSPSQALEIAAAAGRVDVTGGLAAKLSYASEIARSGVDVYLVSGASETDVLKALRGEKTRGTVVSLSYERGRS